LLAKRPFRSENGNSIVRIPDFTLMVDWSKQGIIHQPPVSFSDVVVMVVEATETKDGIGLVVGPVAIGRKGQSNAENSTVSRIKFQVR
jgi:hypothetical protein